MNTYAVLRLVDATDRLPNVFASVMRRAIDDAGVRIGAFAYRTEHAMCPVAATFAYAGANDLVPQLRLTPEEDRKWDERVVEFIHAFDACARSIGLDAALDTVRCELAERPKTPSLRFESLPDSSGAPARPPREPVEPVGLG